jgi:hypothetical protein
LGSRGGTYNDAQDAMDAVASGDVKPLVTGVGRLEDDAQFLRCRLVADGLRAGSW